jgi:hypothetical protein
LRAGAVTRPNQIYAPEKSCRDSGHAGMVPIDPKLKSIPHRGNALAV